MFQARRRLAILFAMMLGALSPAIAQTTAETLTFDAGSRADEVTAIIKSLGPTPGTTTPPPVVVHRLPNVFLPPVIVGRPTTVIIDRRPIVLDYRYSLDLTIYFAHDSAFLTPQAREHLSLIGQALQAPDLANYRYLIAGHTDARGPDDYNVDLSYRRAWAVKRFLMRYFMIPSWRLEVVGWGERYPRNPVDPYAAENRRVEITLIDAVQPIVPQPLPMPLPQPAPLPQTSQVNPPPAPTPLPDPQPVMPPQAGTFYMPPLPPCPAGVIGQDGLTLDLDDFTPEPGIDCNPALPSAGRVIVQPDGRIIVVD